MTYALVAQISSIRPHPDADRLEIIRLRWPAGPIVGGVSLVTGKHYRVNDLGVWLQPGALIPGWLAHDLWLVGKKRANEPFEVRDIEIRGVASPGLWCGQWYRNDNSKESALHASHLYEGGGRLVNGWISWARWNPAWRPGDGVDSELDVRPRPPSSVAEQPVVNRTVAAKTTTSSRPIAGQGDDAVEASGSTPAVGSS